MASAPPSFYLLGANVLPLMTTNKKERWPRDGGTELGHQGTGASAFSVDQDVSSCSQPLDSPVPFLPYPSLVQWPCPVSPTVLPALGSLSCLPAASPSQLYPSCPLLIPQTPHELFLNSHSSPLLMFFKFPSLLTMQISISPPPGSPPEPHLLSSLFFTPGS